MSGSETKKTNWPKSVGSDGLEVLHNKSSNKSREQNKLYSKSRVQKLRDDGELHKEWFQKGRRAQFLCVKTKGM